MATVVVVARSVSFADGVGGMERAAGDHIRALATRGVQIILVSPEATFADLPKGVLTVRVPWPAPRVGRGPVFSLAYFIWTLRVRRTLSHIDSDVNHFHGASVGAVSKAFEARSVCNPHGMEEFGPGSLSRRLSRLPTRVQSRRAAKCAAIVSTDPSLTPLIMTNFNIAGNRVALIPNAVDVQRLRAMVDASVLKPDCFTIVTVGRTVHNKGHDLLMHALKSDKVRQALPDAWVWYHFGSGPGLNALERLSRDFPSVNFVARQGASDSEVQTAIANANLFIQPSRYEGSGLTVLEAMTHGVDVIATPVGGIPDKIEHGVTGLLSSDATSESLADCIVDYFQTDRRFGNAARQTVDSEYSWDAAAERYEALYQEVQQ